MIRFAVASLLVAWLPGALLLRMPGRSRAYRSALPADERLFWSVILSVVWSVCLVLLLGAFGRYAFERLLVINAGVAALVILGLRQRLRWTTPGPFTWSAAVPVAIVALGWWLYFPAAEYVIGGKDPGTYLNEGVQIAQGGRIVVRDETVAAVPPPLRDLFFPSHQQPTYYGLRFMGFFIQDPAAGTVVGQFPHLYPASIAIGYGLDGLTGARNTIGAWAILAIIAVYFAGAQLFGRVAAGAAAALLAINVVVLWFARYPNSELPMQALLFAALLSAARARSGGGRFFAIVSGSLLGLTLFLRYEILLAMMAFAAVAVLAPVTRERLGLAFSAALAITSAAGLWYLMGPMRAYSAYPLGFIGDRGGWVLIGAGAAGAVVTHRLLQIAWVGAAVRRWLPVALAVVLGALAVYAYVFREPAGRTALGDAIAFRSFGWYLTPLALGLAVAGTVTLTWRRFWHAPLFLTTFAVFSVFFFYKTRIVPEHFWTSRRFLAMALPGSLLLAMAFVHDTIGTQIIARTMGRLRAISSTATAVIAAVTTIAVALPMAAAFWRASDPVRRHIEYAGLIPRLETLAAAVGDRDLVIVESRNAGSDLHVLAMPLAYIYARATLVLNSPAPDKRAFEQFVAWARTRYEQVFFLGGGGTDLLTRQVSAVPVSGDRFQVPEYDTPLNRYPDGIHQKEFEYGLYRLTPASPTPAGAVDLAIGTLDDLNVVRFHARETRGDTGVAFRWSRGLSYVLLMGVPPDARHLTVWMSNGGRPAEAPPAQVELSIGDDVIGSAAPRDAIEPHHFDLPASVVRDRTASGDPVRLQLRVPTWNPGQLLGANDTRDLGVIVTRVEVR